MPEMFKNIASWLTTSGIKVLGILIALIILSQMSRWIVKWLERFVPEKDTLQAAEAKKRAQTLGNILRHALLIVISFIALMMILGEVGIQLGPLLATAGIGAVAVGFGAQSLVQMIVKTMPPKQWDVGRELRRRIKNRFDEKGIQIPLPHRILFWGEADKRTQFSLIIGHWSL